MARAQTDDLGQHRIPHLGPGKYYIEARSTPAQSVDYSREPADRPEVPVTTLYPGVLDPAFAVPAEVAAGARLTGVDITLVRANHGDCTLPPNTSSSEVTQSGAAERSSIQASGL